MEMGLNAQDSSADGLQAGALSEGSLRALLHLANLQFTPRMANTLLRWFRWQPEQIFDAPDSEFGAIPGFIGRQLVKLRDKNYETTDRQMRWMEKTGASVVMANSPLFPSALKEIPDPPAFLFVRGTLLPCDLAGVGMVGSRAATPYGLFVADKIASELGSAGVTVVSGGAAGIDTAAHKGALRVGGRTVAILGCGLDVDYPRENRSLFERIVDQGAVISEYNLGAQPDSYRFPQRNRIISGISLGTLVVEAPRNSGSLITARFAAEQGRTVLTVPANIDRPNSVGTNDLLKDGAVPVTETQDILLALRLVAIPARKEDQIALALDTDEDSEGEPAAAGTEKREMKTLQRVILELPPAQRRLAEQLSETPKHLDSLAAGAELGSAAASVEMTMLELAGIARRMPGNTYIRAV